jgi:hypothetical protein
MKTTRRNLLRQWAPSALLGMAGATAFSIADAQPIADGLQVEVPIQVKAGKPFPIRLTLPAKSGANSQWAEVWLLDGQGQKLLARLELGDASATVTLTATLHRPTTLRVRDTQGQVIERRIQVR